MYKNGTDFYTFEDHTLGGKQLSYETVKTLQQLLRSVVTTEKGTGAAFVVTTKCRWKIWDSTNRKRNERESLVCRLFSI